MPRSDDLLLSVPAVQVSDTTGDAMYFAAGKKTTTTTLVGVKKFVGEQHQQRREQFVGEQHQQRRELFTVRY